MVNPRAAFEGACLAGHDRPGFISYADFRWLATRHGARRDDVWLFTDMAVMIDGIARKGRSPP
jgi:hypothetical protein